MPLLSISATICRMVTCETRSRIDRLKDRKRSSGQELAAANALRNRTCVIVPISSVRSATEMKTSGATSPSSGLCHRASASKPTSRAVRDIDDRLIVQRQFGVEIDPPQGVFNGAELADFDFVLPREDHRLAAVSRLGVVERIVGALVEQFRSLYAAEVSMERRITRRTSALDRNKSWLMMPQPASEASMTRTPSRSMAAFSAAPTRVIPPANRPGQRQRAVVRRGNDGDLAAERTDADNRGREHVHVDVRRGEHHGPDLVR